MTKFNIDSGLASLLMMSQFHGISADASKLTHEFGADKFSHEKILLAAQSLGMTGKLVRQNLSRLDQAPLPAVACNLQGEFFILAKVDRTKLAEDHATTPANKRQVNTQLSPDQTRVLIQRPGSPPEVLALDSFLQEWDGNLIFFTSKANFAGAMAKFDFTWFIPAVVKYRKLLGRDFTYITCIAINWSDYAYVLSGCHG